MSEVLYRKWRPQRLDQLVGQEPVVRTLRQAVALGRVAHAYLFCGPRGTGKTSTARILAKAVNCLDPQEGEPDNRCSMCQSMNEGRALDLIEIDAASNRGIDDIRSLRDKIHFTPNEARYKVYIIDEAHMLTEPAFNALLKTLEEPPSHAILILATTEAHKVPATIISRCQRFDFRRVPLDSMVGRLTEVCEEEGVEVAPEALTVIARMAAGSLRDAENLLEQALISYGTAVSEAQVRDLLQLGGDEEALDLVEHIIGRATREGFTVINEVADQGSDLRQLHRGVMEYLRGVLLAKTDNSSSLGYPEDVMARLKSMAETTPLARLVHALKKFSRVDLRRDSSSPLPLELALVESITEPETQPAPASSPVPVTPPVSHPERASQGSQSAVRQPSQPNRMPPASRAPSPPSASWVSASTPRAGDAVRETPEKGESSEPPSRLDSQWDPILRSLRARKGRKYDLGALLRVSIKRVIEDGQLTLLYSHRSHMERMRDELDDPPTRRLLTEAFSEFMEGEFDIKASMVGGDVPSADNSAANRSPLVRAAQAMGARVVDEKEDTGEQEHAPTGAAAPEAHAEDPGGA